MTRAVTLLLPLTFVLTACATVPLPPERAAALDYGIEPTDPETSIRAFVGARLKDPMSAVYSPITHDGQSAISYYGRTIWGWRYSCTVNAKNSFGAYTGAEPFTFIIRDGTIWGFRVNGSTLVLIH